MLPKARHIGMSGYMCTGPSMPYCVQQSYVQTHLLPDSLSTFFMCGHSNREVMKCFPSASCQSMTIYDCAKSCPCSIDMDCCMKAVTCRVSLFTVPPLTQSTSAKQRGNPGFFKDVMWFSFQQDFDVPPMLSLQSAWQSCAPKFPPQ